VAPKNRAKKAKKKTRAQKKIDACLCAQRTAVPSLNMEYTGTEQNQRGRGDENKFPREKKTHREKGIYGRKLDFHRHSFSGRKRGEKDLWKLCTETGNEGRGASK